MRHEFNFWADSEDSFEHEIAHGHMGRQATNRALRKHRILVGVLEIGRNVCFKKDQAAAPPPDPQIGQAATMNAELGNKWLDFSRQQFAAGEKRQDVYDNLIRRTVDSQIDTQDKANAWAQQDRDQGQAGKTRFDQLADQAAALGSKYEGQLQGDAEKFGQQAQGQYDFATQQQNRYNSTFAPIEDKLASDAANWDSSERLASEAAKARGDVLDASARARATSARSMAAMGVNPNSGRFAGQARTDAMNEALSAAGAENLTRDAVQMQAQQLRGQAAGVGQQVLANSATARGMGLQATQAAQNARQAASGAATAGLTQEGQLRASGLGAAGVGYQGLGVGLTAGNSAVGNQGAGQSSFMANNSIMSQGFQGAMEGYKNQGSILNNLYGTQVSAANAAAAAGAQKQAGTMGAIGTVAGAALMVF